MQIALPRAYFVGAQSELDEWDDTLRTELTRQGGDWVVVPGAEHHMNFDNPQGFADAIAARVSTDALDHDRLGD